MRRFNFICPLIKDDKEFIIVQNYDETIEFALMNNYYYENNLSYDSNKDLEIKNIPIKNLDEATEILLQHEIEEIYYITNQLYNLSKKYIKKIPLILGKYIFSGDFMVAKTEKGDKILNRNFLEFVNIERKLTKGIVSMVYNCSSGKSGSIIIDTDYYKFSYYFYIWLGE